jgi:ABC-type lipoprotein export system ATPase subunit
MDGIIMNMNGRRVVLRAMNLTKDLPLGQVVVHAVRGIDLEIYENEKIGFVFQFFNLIPTLTALENVALPIQFARQPKFDPEKRARELLDLLGLSDRLNHRPMELSGGQQQRVAIARALANNPPLLLADEPTGNLDSEASAVVIEALRDVWRETGTTVILVTHDPELAGQMGRVLHLVDGRIID